MSNADKRVKFASCGRLGHANRSVIYPNRWVAANLMNVLTTIEVELWI